MASTTQRYQQLYQRIHQAAARSGRSEDSIGLLAVSKRQSAAAIRELAALGQRQFGENYLQEALPKIDSLAPLALEWHFIGELQSNKTSKVASAFDWVHSLDRLKIAQRLHEQRPENRPPLNVCVEINISGEKTKGGIAPDEVVDFIAELNTYSRLTVRGLMALPAPEDDGRAFRSMHTLFDTIHRQSFDTLSMGTSGDFETAIEHGATLIRVGTLLFGPRQ